MAQNNFWIDLVATLKKAQSKKQITSDAKNLGDIKIPLIGTLNKKATKAQIKQDLASLNGTINLTGKMDKKGTVTSVQQTMSQAQSTANRNSIQVSMSLKKDKLINDIKIFGQQNTKLFKDANMTAKYNSLLDNAKLATSAKQIQDLRMQLSAMRSEIKATNLSGLTLGDTFKKTFKRATELFTGTGGVMLLSQQLRKAWTEALDLDGVYTDLIKVQNELTRGDYPEYLERCNKKAQELATTQKALIESATEFSKSGYNLTTSNALAEQATVLSNVGDLSATDSSKAIISGVQAYEEVHGYTDTIDKAKALMDAWNEIGNTASITTAEIAQGVQKVGSVFADANTSVDEFIALLAAGNRQYQDADALALGLRTSALRIRGCTTELELMGEETEGVITSTAKLEEKIKALTNINGTGGVEILEADGETFRSIYDIFLDISKVYQDMSDTDQSALLELISGKHRASAISATLNNMSEAQEIYQRSLESSGSAQEEYDKYLQSSEASLNRFKSTMTETYQSVINGDTVSGILNCGNATLQFANSIGLVESTLKGLVAIGIVKAITTLSTAFKASAISASNFGTALNTVKNMSTMARGTTEYTNALQTLKVVSAGLSDVQLKQVLSSKALSDADRIAILRTTGLTKAQAQAKLAQMGLVQSTKAQTTAQNTATASTFSLTAAVKGFGASLKAAFLSNPIGIAIMVISTAFGAVTSAIDSANQKAEEARQMAKDAASEANTLGDEVAELTAKYIALSEAVKTDASAKEDLISTQAELLKKLGLEGESIDDLIAKYGSLSNAIRQASVDSLKNSQIDLIAGVDATREELLKVGADGFWGGNNIINATGDDVVKAFKELEKADVVDSGSFGTGGGALVLIGDNATTEGILENYQRLEDALSALRDSNAFTAEELSDNSLYQAIYGRYSEIKDEVEAYKNSITDLNENLAQQTMLVALQGSEIPKTEEAFESFKQELIETAIASKQFIGNEKEITDAVNGYLSTVPEFDGFYSIPLENELDKVDELLSQEIVSKITLDQAKTKVQGSDETTGLIEEFMLLQEVLADTGNVSIETYEKLLTCSDKYSSALKIEAGRIVVDSQKLKLLNKTRTNAIKTEVKEASTLKKLQWINEAKRIQQYRKQQVGLTDNIWDTCDSLQEEINKFDMLVQGIDSASNAFTNFQNAQNASESGDYFDIGLEMANEIQKGLETGKVGVPEFIEAIKGAMPENLFAEVFTMDDADAQFAKIKDWYENVYSQFFIEGEDADYDISGLTNFAKKVEELGYGTFKDGVLSLFDSTDVEKLAQDLQLGAEQVYAIFGELEEYSIGDSFDFDSKNYIEDYYNDLSQLTEAQRLYNEAVESGSEYQIQIANKMLSDAQAEYTEHFTNLADAILQKEQEWQNSSSDKSFADYLLQSYDATELTEILGNAKDRVEELKSEMQQIEKVGQTNSTTYRELGAELEKLETCIGSLENVEDRTTLIGKATETVVNNFKRFTELVDIIQNSDMGSEELAQATQEASELVNQLGYIPDSVKFTIESNVKEIDAEISALNSEIESMKQLAASTTSTSMQQAIQSSINTKQTKVDGLTEQSAVLHGILEFDTTKAFADIERFKAEDVNKEGTVTYNADFSGVNSATPPTLNGVVNYTAKFSGLPNLLSGGSNTPTKPVNVNGTMNAYATGTAQNVSIKKNEEAVVNELGEEGLIRNGKLIPIKGGVQLLKLKKNDIVLNHKQMEALKKNGHAVGRGKLVKSAYVNGSLDGLSAYSGVGNTVSGSSNFSQGTKTTNNSNRGSLDNVKDDIEDVIDETTDDIEEASKEVFDWIERRISKLQRLTDKWIKNAETALTSGFITKYFNKAAKTLNKELSVQEKAFHRYQAEADKSGLSDDWKKKVNDGLVDIETITDETLAEQINDYQNWHDKSIACLEAFAVAAEKRFNIPLEKAKAKIENFNEVIDLLGKKLDNARFRTKGQLDKANALVEQQTDEEENILNAYKKAKKDSKSNLKKQSKKMTSSAVLKSKDVSKEDKKKIKSAVKKGEEIDLSLFKEGSKAYQQAVKYNEALKANKQAAYDAAVAQEEYNSWLVEASKIKFDNIAQFYENKIKMLDYQMTDVENRLNEVEKAGLKVNRSYYDLQKQINADTLKYYQEERVKLEESLKGIKKGTEEWYDAYDAIKQIDEEISNCITTTYELNEAIRQLYFDAHEGVRSDIDAIIDEQEFLTSLFAHEDRASADIGNLTDAGIASLGSAVAKKNLSEERAKEDEAFLKQLQDIYTKYQNGDKNALSSSNLPFDSVEQLEDAIKDLYQTWQDDIKTTYDMQAEVVDIMTEKYEAELEMYQNLVDEYSGSL